VGVGHLGTIEVADPVQTFPFERVLDWMTVAPLVDLLAGVELALDQAVSVRTGFVVLGLPVAPSAFVVPGVLVVQ
jgi:hypothetical protein